jgi:hypothetical protein
MAHWLLQSNPQRWRIADSHKALTGRAVGLVDHSLQGVRAWVVARAPAFSWNVGSWGG